MIEVRDLFHAVPARLKFLKSDRAESAAITEIVRRIAIAFPGVRFELTGEDRTPTIFDAVSPALERIGRCGPGVRGEFPWRSMRCARAFG